MCGNDAAPRHVHEASVLKPVDASLSSDEWPIFALTDAAVYRPDGVTMANALLINQEGPFVVRGRLDVEDDSDDVQYLLQPTQRSADIQIEGSKSYSIGYDPQAVVWLSGQCGWFEINPHPSYAHIYKDMCEVAQLYYVLVEIYEAGERAAKKDRRKVLTAMDIKDVLFEYAVAVGDGTTYDEAVDKCLRLAPALLAHLSIATDLPWKSTSFYRWLEKESRDRERSRRSASRGDPVPETAPAATPVPPPARPPPPASLAQRLPQSLPFRASPSPGVHKPTIRESPVPLPPQTLWSGASAGAAAAAAAPPRPPPPPPATSPPQPASMVSPEERQAVFREYLRIVESIGQELGNPGQLSVSKVHGKFYTGYRLKEYNLAKHLSAFFRHELQASLSDAWHGGRYFRWLSSDEAVAFIPASDLFLRDVPAQMVRRTPANTHSGAAAKSHSGSPAPSQASSAGGSTAPHRHGLRPAGKRAILRPPTVSRKRRFEDTFGEGSSSLIQASGDGEGFASDATDGPPRALARPVGRPRKATKSGHGDEHALAAMQVDSEEEDDDDDGDDDEEIRSRKETLFAVHAEPLLLSTQPTGPNRTWTCPQPGCHFFVRDAGTPGTSDDEQDDDDDDDDDSETSSGRRWTARRRIDAHLRTHEEQMLTRMDLAIAEGSRGHVSVDHLLAKIRELADKATARERRAAPTAAAAVAGAAPKPIVRRVLF